MNIVVTQGASSDISTSQLRKKIDFTSWENAGGLDAELNEIQLELNQLPDPCDPDQVAELLETKRTNLFLQYECAIKFSVRDIFLSSGNVEVFKVILNSFCLNNEIYNNKNNNFIIIIIKIDIVK
jgi:hypothetical protein